MCFFRPSIKSVSVCIYILVLYIYTKNYSCAGKGTCMVAEPGRTMASAEERLRVSEQQGVENMKDIGAMEVRMQKVEKVEASMREDYVNVAKRVLTIESVVRRVPTGLLEN